METQRRFTYRVYRTRIAISLFVALLIGSAHDVVSVTAAEDLLSPAAERYVVCVKTEATASAKRHVRDSEVISSSVPEKALLEIVNPEIGKACGDLVDEAMKSPNYDGARAMEQGYHATKSAIEAALVASPPPQHAAAPGSDDYAHGVDLAPGVQEYLSVECRALMEWQLEPPAFRVPRSCVSAAAEAEKKEKAESDRKEAQLLEIPSVRYCLGLKSIEERLENTRNAVAAAKSNPFDDLDSDMREDATELAKLKTSLDDKSDKLEKCVDRIKAAGGLAFFDPTYAIAQANRVPQVKQASAEYAKCTMDRATEFARVSTEPAETIVRAAMGGCSILRQQYLGVLAQRLGIAMTREIAAQEERDTSGALIGHVIATRANLTGQTKEPAAGQ